MSFGNIELWLMSLYMSTYKDTINVLENFAQLAGAVEYTDCTSAEGYDPP